MYRVFCSDVEGGAGAEGVTLTADARAEVKSWSGEGVQDTSSLLREWRATRCHTWLLAWSDPFCMCFISIACRMR
jgi:hypothetical protein